MMDVLLANVALWSGRTNECVDRGREAIALFQEIGDRWGEVMATGSVVRALAELGHDDEYADGIGALLRSARDDARRGHALVPGAHRGIGAAPTGHAGEAARVLDTVELGDPNELGVADAGAALGLARLQLGDVDGAIDVLEGVYAVATDDGPKLGVGCRLALAYAAAHRRDDAAKSSQELSERNGGTYSDRMIALWAESLVHVQTGSGDGRGSVDAAYAIATATDARARTRDRGARAGVRAGSARRRRSEGRPRRRRAPTRVTAHHRRRLAPRVRPRPPGSRDPHPLGAGAGYDAGSSRTSGISRRRLGLVAGVVLVIGDDERPQAAPAPRRTRPGPASVASAHP